jgi:cobalt-precorrin-5B (C1)-methyltransferase
VLKYLRQHPIKRLTLAGGFGKFCKLADGVLDLQSGRSQVNLDTLARWAAEHGASELTRRLITEANTASEALTIAQQQGVPLAQAVADKAQQVALEEVNGKVAIEILVYDREGRMVAGTGFN